MIIYQNLLYKREKINYNKSSKEKKGGDTVRYGQLGTRFHYNNVYSDDPLTLSQLKLLQIGELCLEAGFEMAPHAQFCHEISYVVSGKGHFILDGVAQKVTAGDVIVTPHSGVHAIVADEDDELDFCFLGFDFIESGSPLAERYFDAVKTAQRVGSRRRDLYECYRRAMDELSRREQPDRLMIESYLAQIVMLACRPDENERPAFDGDGQKSDIGRTVYLAMKYIDRNIDKALTVAGVAESMGYSPYYLSHLFKAKMHQTLQSYIAGKKMERAQKLMQLKRYSVTEIAEMLSYLNIQTFSRLFKKTTGLSPTAYMAQLPR